MAVECSRPGLGNRSGYGYTYKVSILYRDILYPLKLFHHLAFTCPNPYKRTYKWVLPPKLEGPGLFMKRVYTVWCLHNCAQICI